jgi:hypothetical protein
LSSSPTFRCPLRRSVVFEDLPVGAIQRFGQHQRRAISGLVPEILD